MVLTLSFTSQALAQALAQAPIEGWDKAKFGMSPEELRSAYREEEIHIPEFWEDEELSEKWRILESNDTDHTSRSIYPQILVINDIEILGENVDFVTFFFVLNRLFGINISFTGASTLLPKTEDVEKSEDLTTKIEELKTFLVEKYGSALETEVAQKNENDEWTKSAMWTDTRGNSLALAIDYERLEVEGNEYDLLVFVNIIYLDKNLTELWEKKISKLGIIGMESF